MYLYLETEKKVDGKMVPSGVFNFRGELGKGDDPESFTKRMARGNLRVITGEKRVGHPKDKNVFKGIPLAHLNKELGIK